MSAAFLLSWVAVAALMSSLIAVAAIAAQQLTARTIPTRAIWAIAVLAMLGVTMTQPLRRAAAPAALPVPASTTTVAGGLVVDPPTATERLGTILLNAPSAVLQQLTLRASAAGQSIPAATREFVVALWPATSVAIGVILLASYRRQRALLQRAERRPIAGTMVHISERTGPAVIGAAEPAIVVPQWLLERSEEEQQLVVAHEAAHIAARDPQLLLAGCALVALMPWNPAAWFALARLRLAIELDCDARVLARGTNTRKYGQLLIELSAAAPSPAIPVGAPAFSFRPSHLERRLRTMTARPARFLAARQLSAALIGAAALVTACGAELPTAADLQGMDVAKAEQRIGQAMLLDSAQTQYLVNGKVVEARIARDIPADSIATINLRKREKLSEVEIVTKGNPRAQIVEGPERTAIGKLVEVPAGSAQGTNGAVAAAGTSAEIRDSDRSVVVNGIRLGSPSTAAGVQVSIDERSATPAIKLSPTAEPVFFVDGKQVPKEEINKLSKAAIQGVNILKGTAAAAKYGPEASAGAVEITLKK